jgi:hypothetical protein
MLQQTLGNEGEPIDISAAVPGDARNRLRQIIRRTNSSRSKMQAAPRPQCFA